MALREVARSGSAEAVVRRIRGDSALQDGSVRGRAGVPSSASLAQQMQARFGLSSSGSERAADILRGIRQIRQQAGRAMTQQECIAELMARMEGRPRAEAPAPSELSAAATADAGAARRQRPATKRPRADDAAGGPERRKQLPPSMDAQPRRRKRPATSPTAADAGRDADGVAPPPARRARAPADQPAAAPQPPPPTSAGAPRGSRTGRPARPRAGAAGTPSGAAGSAVSAAAGAAVAASSAAGASEPQESAGAASRRSRGRRPSPAAAGQSSQPPSTRGPGAGRGSVAAAAAATAAEGPDGIGRPRAAPPAQDSASAARRGPRQSGQRAKANRRRRPTSDS